MKKLLLLVLLTITFSSFGQSSNFTFVGKWKGVDKKNEIGYIVFDKEGYAYFEFQGQKFGGKEFVYDGKKGSMSYTINLSKTPIEIDITLTKIEEQKTKKILCIAQQINKDEMKLNMNFDGVRPKDFSGKIAMVFKRVKE